MALEGSSDFLKSQFGNVGEQMKELTGQVLSATQNATPRSTSSWATRSTDRLTRSLADFAKIVETFDKAGASFVSVTQQFNTTTSIGRLTLNVLLSFAQFEREVTGERIRDKTRPPSKRAWAWAAGCRSAMTRKNGTPHHQRARGQDGPNHLSDWGHGQTLRTSP